VLPVVDDAEGHHAVEGCDLFHLDLFLVVFHCCEGFVRRRSDSLAIYSRTSSSLPLGLNFSVAKVYLFPNPQKG
jgi:hypothetical protein